MGMYTEFHFNVKLKQYVPNEVLDILNFMLGEDQQCSISIPDHELFQSSRWKYMLRCDSYYFAADTHSTLRYDVISEQYYLCIRCNLKNYGEEIQKFISWIMPYVDCEHEEDSFLGFYRYEEQIQPTLIYHPILYRVVRRK